MREKQGRKERKEVAGKKRKKKELHVSKILVATAQVVAVSPSFFGRYGKGGRNCHTHKREKRAHKNTNTTTQNGWCCVFFLENVPGWIDGC